MESHEELLRMADELPSYEEDPTNVAARRARAHRAATTKVGRFTDSLYVPPEEPDGHDGR